MTDSEAIAVVLRKAIDILEPDSHLSEGFSITEEYVSPIYQERFPADDFLEADDVFHKVFSIDLGFHGTLYETLRSAIFECFCDIDPEFGKRGMGFLHMSPASQCCDSVFRAMYRMSEYDTEVERRRPVDDE